MGGDQVGKERGRSAVDLEYDWKRKTKTVTTLRKVSEHQSETDA